MWISICGALARDNGARTTPCLCATAVTLAPPLTAPFTAGTLASRRDTLAAQALR